MICKRNKIYNKKTKKCIKDTSANRTRLGMKPKKTIRTKTKSKPKSKRRTFVIPILGWRI